MIKKCRIDQNNYIFANPTISCNRIILRINHFCNKKKQYLNINFFVFWYDSIVSKSEMAIDQNIYIFNHYYDISGRR